MKLTTDIVAARFVRDGLGELFEPPASVLERHGDDGLHPLAGEMYLS